MPHQTPRPTLLGGSTEFSGLGNMWFNLSEPDFIAEILARDEGVLGLGGAVLVNKGRLTGRLAKDKFVVRTGAVEGTVWWDNNGAVARGYRPSS